MSIEDINAWLNLAEVILLLVLLAFGAREVIRRDRLLNTFVELLDEVTQLREDLTAQVQEMSTGDDE